MIEIPDIGLDTVSTRLHDTFDPSYLALNNFKKANEVSVELEYIESDEKLIKTIGSTEEATEVEFTTNINISYLVYEIPKNYNFDHNDTKLTIIEDDAEKTGLCYADNWNLNEFLKVGYEQDTILYKVVEDTVYIYFPYDVLGDEIKVILDIKVYGANITLNVKLASNSYGGFCKSPKLNFYSVKLWKA